MKRLFLLIKSILILTGLLISEVAFSQNLILTSNGEPVENKSSIEVFYTVDDWTSIGFDMWEYNWNPHLELSTVSGSEDVRITVSADETTDYFSLCWPTSCQMVLPDKPLTVEGTVTTLPSDLQLHGSMKAYSSEVKPVDNGHIDVKIESATETIEVSIVCLPNDSNGVNENYSDLAENPEYYTLNGYKVSTPGKGLYIVKIGNSLKKVLIK